MFLMKHIASYQPLLWELKMRLKFASSMAAIVEESNSFITTKQNINPNYCIPEIFEPLIKDYSKELSQRCIFLLLC